MCTVIFKYLKSKEKKNQESILELEAYHMVIVSKREGLIAPWRPLKIYMSVKLCWFKTIEKQFKPTHHPEGGRVMVSHVLVGTM